MSAEDATTASFDELWQESIYPSLGRDADATASLTPAALLAANVPWEPTEDGSIHAQEQAHPTPIIQAVADTSSLPALHISTESQDEEPTGSEEERSLRLGVREYEVIDKLGEGGMGRVDLAQQLSLKRLVALKRIKPERKKATVRKAMLREGRLMGALEHPNIIPVYELGRDEHGDPVIVMKRVSGVSWETLRLDATHNTWQHVSSWSEDVETKHLEILMEVANAVHFAHSKGIIHRDIKTSNVMIGDFGEVYLLDWGVAMRRTPPSKNSQAMGRQWHLGRVAGTPAYMAPEMVFGDKARIDERSDVYLLGATLHTILTDEPPHQGEDLYEVLKAAFRSTPQEYDKEIPMPLAEICHRAMHPNPTKRFASVLQFREAIAHYLRLKQSLRLTKAARARQQELQALLQQTKETVDKIPEPEALYHLFHESRFGYRMALEESPDNPEAQSGLCSCIEMMAHYELRRDNASTARALLTELPKIPQELQDALQRADRRQATKEADLKRLQHMAHEGNLWLRTGFRQRLIFGIIMFVLINTTSLLALFTLKHQPEAFTLKRSAYGIAGVIFAMHIALFLARRWVFSNQAHKKLLSTVMLSLWATMLNRIFFIAMQLPMASAFVIDTFLMGIFLVGIGLIFHPLFMLSGIPLVGLALLSSFSPSMVYINYTIGGAIGWFSILLWWLLQSHRADNPDEHTKRETNP